MVCLENIAIGFGHEISLFSTIQTRLCMGLRGKYAFFCCLYFLIITLEVLKLSDVGEWQNGQFLRVFTVSVHHFHKCQLQGQSTTSRHSILDPRCEYIFNIITKEG